MTQKKQKKPKTPAKSHDLIDVLKDERKRKAALVLAYAGYQRGAKHRSGAITHAARQAGVDRDTIYAWLDNPTFAAAVDEVSGEVVTEALQCLRNAARKMNVLAAIYLLKIHSPDRFDDQFVRDEAKRAHDLEVLKLKLEHGDPDEQRPMPTFVYRETAPGERIAPSKETEH